MHKGLSNQVPSHSPPEDLQRAHLQLLSTGRGWGRRLGGRRSHRLHEDRGLQCYLLSRWVSLRTYIRGKGNCFGWNTHWGNKTTHCSGFYRKCFLILNPLLKVDRVGIAKALTEVCPNGSLRWTGRRACVCLFKEWVAVKGPAFDACSYLHGSLGDALMLGCQCPLVQTNLTCLTLFHFPQPMSLAIPLLTTYYALTIVRSAFQRELYHSC